ncbi:GerMN domain-containing protein [Laedolimicola sp.]|uniref:GerMN domain-containing protein n=1 Tax=Laedolimicola sp. TaxID=2981663 RepID=UPI003F7FB813
MKEKRKQSIRLCGLLSLLLLLALLGGCKKKENTEAKTDEKGYQIYYLNKDETATATVNYQPEAKDTDGLIQELLKKLATTPEGGSLEAVLTDSVFVTDYTLDNGQLTLHFDPAYQDMDWIREILCRSAVVRTLCQIPDVEYVSFLIGDNPLMDLDKNPVGQMNADSFVENTGDAINEETVTTLTLYFANKSGDKLVKEKVNVTGSSNISVEKLVVESLIRGPVSGDTDYPTLPSGTKILSISTKDGICYVNLNDGFLEQGYNVTEAVTIYSIVDSLTELSGISKVQILVNGETDLVYKESMRLDTIYERNLDIIEQGE